MKPGRWAALLVRPTPAASASTTAPKPCVRPGVRYLPLVWEAQGGCTPETRAFLHRLSGAVALVEGAALDDVKARLLGQISVVLSRATGRAIRRRRALIEDQAPGVHTAVAELLLDP